MLRSSTTLVHSARSRRDRSRSHLSIFVPGRGVSNSRFRQSSSVGNLVADEHFIIERPVALPVEPQYKESPLRNTCTTTEYHPSRQLGKSPTGEWTSPVYTHEELHQVDIIHRAPDCTGDKVALALVKLCRWGFDVFSQYKHKPIPPGSTMTLAELRQGGYVMTDSQWLMRIIFLETVAGVPGMVAATVRHLRSLRLMTRDAGWIHTLLEEAENERMHLMTFMHLKKPSIWFRALILAAQGVFYNAFFLGYLVSPKSAHRFVGFLEEEAVVTYTRCISEIEANHIPEWTHAPAPPLAIAYWRLPPTATLLDVIKAVRADECAHRFVNHSLANLSREDVCPFAVREPGMDLMGGKSGFSRKESEEFVSGSRELVGKARDRRQD
ncbi:alternative oxidase [Ceratobasidium sp. AG-I]|nr:alternative oxidase [Ceratobasidium sp. AG-I]